MNSSAPSTPADEVGGDTTPLTTARDQISNIWFFGTIVFGAVTLLFAFTGSYEGQWPQLMGWASPAVLPTLTLIYGVLGPRAIRAARDSKVDLFVQRNFFMQARWISYLYFVALLGCLVWATGWAPQGPKTGIPSELATSVGLSAGERIAALGNTNAILSVIQSVVVFFVGSMFVSSEKKSSGAAARSQAPRTKSKPAEGEENPADVS